MSEQIAERDAIVRWLRQPVIEGRVYEWVLRLKMAWYWIFRPTRAMRIGLLVAADTIERGEHRKDTHNG